MKIIINPISFLCLMLGLSACDKELLNEGYPKEKIEVKSSGVPVCYLFESFWSENDPFRGDFGDYCAEKTAYPEQIANADMTRFDAEAYTAAANNSGSLVGNWMVLYPNQLSERRESCDLTASEDDINTLILACKTVADIYETMVYDVITDSLAIRKFVYSRARDRENSGFTLTSTTTGQITHMNRIDVSTKRVKEYPDGERVESTTPQFTLVRLGDIGHPLGKLSVEKFDFEKNLLLMEEHDVAYLVEKSGSITLSDNNGDVLAAFPANLILKNTTELPAPPYNSDDGLYGNSYVNNLFPGVALDLFDVDPQFAEKVGISNLELRLRQFDYLANDSSSMALDFLINRSQATRFERGDTVGKLRLSF